MTQESADKLNEAFERKAEQENYQGACGNWVCAVSNVDRNNVAIYWDTAPPGRELIQQVTLTLGPITSGGIEAPTIDEAGDSHDFLQACMQTAWRLGYRPGKVTRTGAEQFVKALQNEGLVLVQGIGAKSWRDHMLAKGSPPIDPVERLRGALQDFLADAFTPDPERPPPENVR